MGSMWPARVDVAIRPGGDRREVSNDQAGIAALVAHAGVPQPWCWRLRVGWNCPWWQPWQRWWVNPEVRDFAWKPLGGWPRPSR